MISNGNSTIISVIPGKYENPLVQVQHPLLDQVNSQLTPFGISLTFIRELQRYAFTGSNISNVENFDVNNNYIYNTFGWKLGFRHSYYSKDAKRSMFIQEKM